MVDGYVHKWDDKLKDTAGVFCAVRVFATLTMWLSMIRAVFQQRTQN